MILYKLVKFYKYWSDIKLSLIFEISKFTQTSQQTSFLYKNATAYARKFANVN
jgi:hypothetical protein